METAVVAILTGQKVDAGNLIPVISGILNRCFFHISQALGDVDKVLEQFHTAASKLFKLLAPAIENGTVRVKKDLFDASVAGLVPTLHMTV